MIFIGYFGFMLVFAGCLIVILANYFAEPPPCPLRWAREMRERQATIVDRSEPGAEGDRDTLPIPITIDADKLINCHHKGLA